MSKSKLEMGGNFAIQHQMGAEVNEWELNVFWCTLQVNGLGEMS